MFLQLLGFAVALTMTATASAKAVSHDQPDGLAGETSLRTEPKRAYYDPTETYGTATGTFYNYTDNRLYEIKYQSGPSTPYIEPNSSGEYYWSSNVKGSGNAGIAVASYTFTQEDWSNIDFYYNGEIFTNTLYYNANLILLFETQPTGYIWAFDHEPEPTEEEIYSAEIGGIFTEVGNIVTGMADTLTKPWDGIVNIFYDTTAEEVTPLGMISLITLGTSVVIMLFAIAIRLFRQRG